ncbi:hypothetical protein PUN28_006510 [Cardiocondyla obscurior]|uniref:Uncharacterized protein n=1 Tax=Cardiocondyla obscurior TaxID=286306 RepID=A0AAW2GAN6_9HYME
MLRCIIYNCNHADRPTRLPRNLVLFRECKFQGSQSSSYLISTGREKGLREPGRLPFSPVFICNTK